MDSTSSHGRRRRRWGSQNPAWDVLARGGSSDEDCTPRRALKGRKTSRAKAADTPKSHASSEQYEYVPDTPEDGLAVAPGENGHDLLRPALTASAEKSSKPVAAALLQQHNAQHQCTSGNEAPAYPGPQQPPMAAGTMAMMAEQMHLSTSTAPQASHPAPAQPQCFGHNPAPAQHHGPEQSASAIPVGHQLPTISMGLGQEGLATAGNSPHHVRPVPPSASTAQPWPVSSEAQHPRPAAEAQLAFGRSEPTSEGGPQQALAAQRQDSGGCNAQHPASFLDRAVQLLREETRHAALSQKQRAGRDAPPACGRAAPAVLQRTAGGTAAITGSDMERSGGMGGIDLVAPQLSWGTTARPTIAAIPPQANGRQSGSAGLALHPVSYHQPPPAVPPKGCNPAASSLPLVGSSAAGVAAADSLAMAGAPGPAAVRPAAMPGARSPAEQLGLRRSGGSVAVAAAAAESTPVGHMLPEASGNTACKSSGFSPMDEDLLAQIASIERKAAHDKATQQAATEGRVEAAGPTAPAAVAPLSAPRSLRAPSTGGKSGWSDTPDSAIERMLHDVETKRGIATGKESPAPVRLLAFTPTAGTRPAPPTEAAGDGHSGSRAAAQPTSHLGRSALQQAQSFSFGEPARSALPLVPVRGGVPLASEPPGSQQQQQQPAHNSGRHHGAGNIQQQGPSAAVPPPPQLQHPEQQQWQHGPPPAALQQLQAAQQLANLHPQQFHQQHPQQEQQHWQHEPRQAAQQPLQGLQQHGNLHPPQQQQHPQQPRGSSIQPQHGLTSAVPSSMAHGLVRSALQQLSPWKQPLPVGLPPSAPVALAADPYGTMAAGTSGAAPHAPPQMPGGTGVEPMAMGGNPAAEGDSVQPASKRPRVDAGLNGEGANLAAAAGSGPPEIPVQQPQQEAGMREGDMVFDYGAVDDTEYSSDEENERNIPLLSQYVSSTQKLRLKEGAQSPPAATAPSFGASPQASPPANVLDAYLPADVCDVFRQTGVTGTLYDWQAECLCQPGVLRGRNLVYCAPTSGGKSLVAEVLMVRRIQATGRPAMLVLPFVSLCSEKSAHLTRLLSPLNKEVKDFFGSSHSHASLSATTGVIVCTIEKANILINRMLEDQNLNILSCLVVDELHMVGDEDRGYQLELLLTKLRYAAAACDAEDDEDFLSEGLQIIGMSATLPNVECVAKWLNAELYQTEFRPVPLKQFLKVGREVRDEHQQVIRTLEAPPDWEKQDPDHVVWLTKETVDGGHSVLVFCCSKNQCQTTAKLVARLVQVPERQLPMKGLDLTQQRPNRESICEDLKRIPGGADPTLMEAMARGVAFHHAGLSSEERELVELAYKCGAVSVLCATSTLAAGVNLPARRVIFKHPYVGYSSAANVLDGTKYRQMAGRAGRAGVDTYGESYLIAVKDVALNRLETLMVEGAKPVESCLIDTKKGMKRAMLEVVASGVVTTADDVMRYVGCTLLAAMNAFELVKDTTITALKWLGQKEHSFIAWNKETDSYDYTPFGKAVLASGLPPEVCMLIKADLAKARESFVMTTELHLTYLCVPITEDIAPDWGRFYDMIEQLQGAAHNVATKVGVNRGFAMQQSRGMGSMRGNTKRSQQQAENERICKRFWAALILTDLIQEMDMVDVQRKYGVSRAVVQGLQDRASRFASMAAAFCERLGWFDLEALITKFQARVLRGVRQEILALAEIPFVKSHTARLLYKAGLRTPEAVAAVASVDQIVAILNSGAPPGDKKAATMRQRQALKILRGARELLHRRAKELREQAAQALELVQKADAAELHKSQAGDEDSAWAAEPQAPYPAGPEGQGSPLGTAVGQPAQGLPLQQAAVDVPQQQQQQQQQQAPGQHHQLGAREHQQQQQIPQPPAQHQHDAVPAPTPLQQQGLSSVQPRQRGMAAVLQQRQHPQQAYPRPQGQPAGMLGHQLQQHPQQHGGQPPPPHPQQQAPYAYQHPQPYMQQLPPSLAPLQGMHSGQMQQQSRPGHQYHPHAQNHSQHQPHHHQPQQQQQQQQQQQHPPQNPSGHQQQYPPQNPSGHQQWHPPQNPSGHQQRLPQQSHSGHLQQPQQPYQQHPSRPQQPQQPYQQHPHPSWQEAPLAGQQQHLQQQRLSGRGGSGKESGGQAAGARGRGSGGQRDNDASDSDEDEEGLALLDSPPERLQEPDPWELAGRTGPHMLSSPQQVRQMRCFLEERYERFAFMFDIITCVPSPTFDLPAGPSIARRSPTRKAQKEQAKADKQSTAVLVRVEGVALSWRDGQSVYVPIHSAPEMLAELAPLFASPRLEKATFDLKLQLAQLVRANGPGVLGIGPRGAPAGSLMMHDPLLDMRIAAWIATPEDKKLKDDNTASLDAKSSNSYTLEALLRLKAGQPSVQAATQGMHSGANGMSIRRIDLCRKAAITRKLAHVLLATLESYGGMLAPLRQTEMPLVRVLVDMEAAGIAMNEAVIEREKPMLQQRILELEKLAHGMAGEEFNLGSTTELSQLLFEKLKLPPPPNANPLKSGGWSTNGDVLRELAAQHPLPRLIMEHRKLTTLLGRFMNSFQACLRHAEPQHFPGGLVLKRIRGSINQTCSDTGRLAMDEPNLQTVPKPLTYSAVASPPLQDGSGSLSGNHRPHTVNMRCAFVAPPGWLLLSADYRQLEFRLMAHFSQDAGLLRMFADDSNDPFQLLAARWIGISDPSKVTKEQRDHAKQLTYGILYGMGPGALAEGVGCPEREAKEMMDSFRKSLPGIEAWQAGVIEQCKKTTYVETFAGRRRWLSNIRSPNYQKRSKAERQAVNTVCQGSAADLSKAAMIAVYRRVAAELPPGCCRMLLQIHDEFLFEVQQECIEQAARLVRECMEGVATLSVPLRVRLSWGPSWGELQEKAL